MKIKGFTSWWVARKEETEGRKERDRDGERQCTRDCARGPRDTVGLCLSRTHSQSPVFPLMLLPVAPFAMNSSLC